MRRLRDVLKEDEKQPYESPADTVADIVSEACSYMSAIFADSVAQSSLSFWIMHSESIHMKLRPSKEVTVIASWKVFGKVFQSIPLFLCSSVDAPSSVVACAVTHGWLLPQQ